MDVVPLHITSMAKHGLLLYGCGVWPVSLDEEPMAQI